MDSPVEKSDDAVLVIMAKAPRPGSVKTRLTSSLSPEAATEFYKCLLQDTLALARSLESVRVAIMCPESDVDELRQFTGGTTEIVPQSGNGLAAGLISVFAHFTGDRPRPAVAFNSDSPHLPRGILEAAFAALHEYDLVVGPTHDGGYYMVGAKASHPTLFTADAMGTSSALDALLARAQSLSLTVGYVERFYDIDVAEDLTRFAAELRNTPAIASHSARWLRQWELETGQSATSAKS